MNTLRNFWNRYLFDNAGPRPLLVVLTVLALVGPMPFAFAQDRAVPQREIQVHKYTFVMEDSTAFTCAVAQWYNEIALDCDWSNN